MSQPSPVDHPTGASSSPSAAEDPAEVPEGPARPKYRRLRVVRGRLSLAGVAFAVVFFCLSLTPSLLPRSWLLQGAVSGVTSAMGYGIGTTLGALVRRFRRREPNSRAAGIAWKVVIVAGLLLSLLFLALGAGWQRDLRARLGMDSGVAWDVIRLIAVVTLTFVLILLVGRLLRLATRRLARFLGRFVPKPVAYGVGVLVVGYLVVGFVQGFLLSNVLSVANRTASLANGRTSPGITVPTSPQLSGSSASLIGWSTLGQKGRDFVGTVPTREELERFAGKPATDPIRIYAGLESAASFDQQAQLAVRDMERAGAFDRAVVAVITTTGTGWVDEKVAESLEYMYAGDTALVAMQYSYLPSWISFLVDKSKATQSASALINAVRAKQVSLPAASRPKLVVFGESLGSYGTETTYRDLGSVTADSDGALLVGPPFANPIWQELVDERDEGSPVWRPIYDGGDTVRFAQNAADLRSPAGQWRFPRVVYMQNSTDPVVWWNLALLYRAPEWLDNPRGPDVSPDMRWYPGVTFWQVVVDLVFATGVPTGHGHVYGSAVADGWAALLQPQGWTTADTIRLRALLDAG